MAVSSIAPSDTFGRLTTIELVHIHDGKRNRLYWRCACDCGTRVDVLPESRWVNSFGHFIADMGSRPSARHTIDRVDNNADYGPENCRWATKHIQSRNTRRNIVLSHAGRTMVLGDWAVHLGRNRTTLERRIAKGWSIDRVLS